jgi:hypothetical protein
MEVIKLVLFFIGGLVSGFIIIIIALNMLTKDVLRNWR